MMTAGARTCNENLGPAISPIVVVVGFNTDTQGQSGHQVYRTVHAESSTALNSSEQHEHHVDRVHLERPDYPRSTAIAVRAQGTFRMAAQARTWSSRSAHPARDGILYMTCHLALSLSSYRIIK